MIYHPNFTARRGANCEQASRPGGVQREAQLVFISAAVFLRSSRRPGGLGRLRAAEIRLVKHAGDVSRTHGGWLRPVTVRSPAHPDASPHWGEFRRSVGPGNFREPPSFDPRCSPGAERWFSRQWLRGFDSEFGVSEDGRQEWPQWRIFLRSAGGLSRAGDPGDVRG